MNGAGNENQSASRYLFTSFGKTWALADIWFIHAFGESGLCFIDAFNALLAARYNLYVPDLPGFCVTPPNPADLTIQGAANVLSQLIAELSGDRPVILVAHSMSSLIATRVARILSEQNTMYFNIEGNLTHADAFLSGLAAECDNAADFHTAFKQRVFSMLQEDGALHRYYASVRFADPQCLWLLGRSGTAVTRQTNGGEEFLGLSCRKIYYWDSQNVAEETWAYIQQHKFPNRHFRGSGHWPMKGSAEVFYNALLEDLASLPET